MDFSPNYFFKSTIVVSTYMYMCVCYYLHLCSLRTFRCLLFILFHADASFMS